MVVAEDIRAKVVVKIEQPVSVDREEILAFAVVGVEGVRSIANAAPAESPGMYVRAVSVQTEPDTAYFFWKSRLTDSSVRLFTGSIVHLPLRISLFG